MIDAGIHDGDILVIDKSLEPEGEKVVVCFIDGAFTVKRIQKEKDGLYLMPADPKYKPVRITEHNEFIVWGVVTHVIQKM